MPGGTNDPAPTVTPGELLSPTVAAEPDGAHDADASRLPVVGREHYAVEGEFARGGMGRILSARDRRLGRTVALKELQAAASPDARRFVREALVTARLQHPAIVPIYEAGRWPDGVPFYAMKLVTGRSLDALIRAAEGGLAGRLALLPHLLAVAEAVAYAHGQHIVHRDLKPANVLVGAFGETVVVDWGLAKDLGAPATADDEPLQPPWPPGAAETTRSWARCSARRPTWRRSRHGARRSTSGPTSTRSARCSTTSSRGRLPARARPSAKCSPRRPRSGLGRWPSASPTPRPTSWPSSTRRWSSKPTGDTRPRASSRRTCAGSRRVSW